MSQHTLITVIVTCASGYTMIYTGIALRTLGAGMRGRCRRCGRLRVVCTCAGK